MSKELAKRLGKALAGVRHISIATTATAPVTPAEVALVYHGEKGTSNAAAASSTPSVVHAPTKKPGGFKR